jgi:small-conductance mechanosensitive channel
MFDKIINKDMLSEIGIRVGVVLAILIVTVILAKMVKKTMSKKDHFVKIDNTQYKFLSHMITGFIYFFGLLLAIYSVPALRGLATSIFAGSGVLAIVIGFASQQALSNVVGGIFIAIFKPFRLGDRIRLVGKDFIGIVEDVTLRHTVIRTFDYKRIIIPNSVISTELLENADIVDQRTQKFFDIGISYDSDIDKAVQIIKEEALKHPGFLDNRTEAETADNEEPVKVRVIGFGDSSVNLRAYIWANNPTDAFVLGCDLNKSVKERFDNEGVEIPFPYRTLVFKNSEAETRPTDGQSKNRHT